VRDLVDLVERCKKTDTKLASVNDQIDTSNPMGMFFMHMLGAIGQLEREQIQQRVQSAMDHCRAAGRYLGGTVPVGMRVVTREGEPGKYLAVDPETGPIVAEIWNMCTAGHSLREIGDYLAQNGVLGRSDKWTATAVAGLLRKESYRGELVDDATRSQALAALTARGPGHSPRRRKSECIAIMREIAHCAVCGAPMVLAGARGKGGRYYYYRCGKKNNHGRKSCEAKDLPVKAYDEAAAAGIAQAIEEQGEAIISAWSKQLAEMQTRADGGDQRIEALRMQLATVQKRIDAVYALYEAGGAVSVEETKRRLELLVEEKAGYERGIAREEAEAHMAAQSEQCLAEIEAELLAFVASLEEKKADPSLMARACCDLVSRADLASGHLTLTLRAPPGFAVSPVLVEQRRQSANPVIELALFPRRVAGGRLHVQVASVVIRCWAA
jgi:hypothetical protein